MPVLLSLRRLLCVAVVTVCCGHGGRRGICGRRDAVVVVGGVAEEVDAARGLVRLRCSVNAGKYEVCFI
jgi:hypothetical protein